MQTFRKAKQEADIAFEKLPCDQKSLYTADSLAREMVDSSLLDGRDLTDWLLWFIKLMTDACRERKDEIKRKQKNIELIKSIDPNSVNSRQLFMLYKLADGSFYGKLTASKWCKMTKCTPITASRDLSELVRMGILVRIGSGSRDYEYVMRAGWKQ